MDKVRCPYSMVDKLRSPYPVMYMIKCSYPSVNKVRSPYLTKVVNSIITTIKGHSKESLPIDEQDKESLFNDA